MEFKLQPVTRKQLRVAHRTEQRLQILEALPADRQILDSEIELSGSAIRRNLKVMRKAGLVEVSGDGYQRTPSGETIYRAARLACTGGRLEDPDADRGRAIEEALDL